MTNNHQNHIHTKGQLLDFIEDVFKDVESAGKDNINIICPICKAHKGKSYNKAKFAIYIGNDTDKIGSCHCWVCGYKSKSLYRIIKKYKSDYLDLYINNFKNSTLLEIDKELIDNIEITKEVKLPDDYKLLAVNLNDTSTYEYQQYLKHRGCLSEDMLWYWKFGYSKHMDGLKDRIIIPSFDHFGKINYYSARTIKDIKPKYINPTSIREEIIFNEINLDWNKELTIVEGVFDLIKANTNATCILGSELTSEYELFNKIVLNKTPVVLGLDLDAKRKEMKLAKNLYEFGIQVKIIEYKNKDKDIGEMNKNEFMELYHNAILFDTEYLLKYKVSLL
jgi:hypothetical protein